MFGLHARGSEGRERRRFCFAPLTTQSFLSGGRDVLKSASLYTPRRRFRYEYHWIGRTSAGIFVFCACAVFFKGLDGGMGCWRLFTLSSVAFGMHISGLGAIAHCPFSSRLRLFCFFCSGRRELGNFPDACPWIEKRARDIGFYFAPPPIIFPGLGG